MISSSYREAARSPAKNKGPAPTDHDESGAEPMNALPTPGERWKREAPPGDKLGEGLVGRVLGVALLLVGVQVELDALLHFVVRTLLKGLELLGAPELERG
jgi:hypothetical protein